MSRSGYTDDFNNGWTLIRWRGAVASALRGRRGQAFLRELIAALDALPEKKLIVHELEVDGAVCAIGAVGRQRGIDMTALDPEDHEKIAATFDVAHALTCEIFYINDEELGRATPEERFLEVRRWAVSKIEEKKDGIL